MAFNIAYTYQLIDKYTAPIQKIIAATRAHTRYLKENQDAIKASNALLKKLTVDSGKTGTAVTRLSNRTERLNGSLKALQHNNAFDHLTTQARAFNEQIERMHRVRPNIPGFGPGAGQDGVPGTPGSGRGAQAGRATKSRLSRFGAAASGLTGLGTGAGISAVLKQTAAVENAMIDMARATDLPATELKKFEERFMTLSETIGITTDKLAIMAFEGSKTGIDTKDLDKYVKLTANASVAFEILEDEAGRALGSIKAKMGLNIGSLEELMDRVNFVADATSADGERMVNIIERLTGTFKTLKIPPSVVAGFAGFADQIEVSQERAATGMEAIIGKLMQSPKMAAEMIKDPEKALRAFFKKMEAIPETKRIAVAIKQFGAEHADFALKMATNMKLFDETMKKAADAKAMGSMEREMASKLKSLTMLWKNMKNAVINVMVAIGEGLAPDIKRFGEYLREITPRIREFVREHPGIVKFAAGVAAVVAIITLAVPIAWALGAAFGFIGAALGLLSAPLIIAIGLVAGLASRWDEWVESGHPVPILINDIAASIERIIARMTELANSSGAVGTALTLIGKGFDLLGYALVIPLKLLETYLSVLEKIIGVQGQVQTTGIMAGAGANISNLTPPNIKSALDINAITGQQPSATVGGTITVKAEPGTKAKVSQPNLPTGSNLLMVK